MRRVNLPDNVDVHLLLQLRPFVPRTAVVQHCLRFVASVDDESFHEVRVLRNNNNIEHRRFVHTTIEWVWCFYLQATLAQQQRLTGNRHPFARVVKDGAMEAIDLGGRWVHLDAGSEFAGFERRLNVAEATHNLNKRKLKRISKLWSRYWTTLLSRRLPHGFSDSIPRPGRTCRCSRRPAHCWTATAGCRREPFRCWTNE